jgi:acetyl-CoA acetyltransferase
MVRCPLKDQVAIVGVGSTGYGRDLGRTSASLAIDACQSAIRDAGLEPRDISGICDLTWNVNPRSMYMQMALGIPECTWFADHDGSTPVTHCLGLAVNAIFSGSADIVLMYHSLYRLPSLSLSAARDPFRVRADETSGFAGVPLRPHADVPGLHAGYVGLMSRYLYESKGGREDFGYFVINARTNAVENPLAVMRSPISMEDYLSARMVDDPMCLLDMDIPVDGADAFVLTTVDRARDLPHKPVVVHSISDGRINVPELNLERMGQNLAVRSMWQRSDVRLEDIDVFLPYDGYSFSGVMWLEDVGYCDRGEGGAFMREHWSESQRRILINGKIPVNSHGGALGEGGSQGAGQLREAVVQLRGDAGVRQVQGASTALATSGTFNQNPNGVIFRSVS